MTWNFHVGMEIICIADNWLALIEQVPVVGEKYTIRSIEAVDDRVGLRLEEIINPPRAYREGFIEAQFDAEGFRPLTSWSLDCLLTTKVDIDTREKVDG